MTDSQKKIILFTAANFLAVYNYIINNFFSNGLVAYWPFDETSGLLSRVVNPAVATGRNICLTPDFASGTNWVAGTGWAIGSGVATATAALAAATLSQTVIPLVIGRSYNVTFDLTVTIGSVKVQVGSGGNGTTRSANGTYSETIVCTTSTTLFFNPVSTFTGTIDNVVVNELNIPASGFGVNGGSEKITNGNFNNWITDSNYPDSWKETTNGVHTVVSQVGSGASHGGVGTGSVNLWTDDNTAVAIHQNNILTLGHTYLITLNISAITGTLSIANFAESTVYANYTTTGIKVLKIVANDLGVVLKRGSICDVTIDSVSIVETDHMTANDINGVLNNQPAQKLNKSYLFDGTNDCVDIYSAAFQSAFNINEGTISIFGKVASDGVWTDATVRQLIRILADANNNIQLQKDSTNNQIKYTISFGGTTKTIFTSGMGSTLGYFHMAITWSKANDQIIAYLNGKQTGSTQTGLGQWTNAAAFTISQVVIGAAANSGSTPWSGNLAQPAIFSRPLTATEIFNIAHAGGVV